MQIKLIFALSLVSQVSHGSIGIGSVTRFPPHKTLGVSLATPSPCLDPDRHATP